MANQQINQDLFNRFTERVFTRVVGMYNAGTFTVELKEEDNIQRLTYAFGGMRVSPVFYRNLKQITVTCKSRSAQFNATYQLTREQDIDRIITSIFGAAVTPDSYRIKEAK